MSRTVRMLAMFAMQANSASHAASLYRMSNPVTALRGTRAGTVTAAGTARSRWIAAEIAASAPAMPKNMLAMPYRLGGMSSEFMFSFGSRVMASGRLGSSDKLDDGMVRNAVEVVLWLVKVPCNGKLRGTKCIGSKGDSRLVWV